MSESPQVNTIANWYGSDRMVAERIAAELKWYPWVGIPCCGGVGILRFLKARSGLCADLHCHLINMCRVAGDPILGPKMYRALRRKILHPVELELAQERCVARERAVVSTQFFGENAPQQTEPDLEWAIDYALCSWMGQGGRSGEAKEFNGGMSFRWDAAGGSSAKRFHNWVASLPTWRRLMRGFEFVCMDVFDFLAKLKKDDPKRCLYIDPPWYEAGLKYRHPFTDREHIKLRTSLETFSETRVAIRYGDHPFIRKLYADDRWTIVTHSSRDQQNQEKGEILVLNGPSFVNANGATSENQSSVETTVPNLGD